MSFLDQFQIDQIKSKLVTDLSTLGKIYKAKKSAYITKSVDHSLVDGMINDGWEEYGKPKKTKTSLRKKKSHSVQFEDDIWCQFYELGYRTLNYDNKFILQFSKEPTDKKQIDVVAIDDEMVLLIECKSSEKPKKSPSLKAEFEGLEIRLGGFRKVIDQIFDKKLKVKYIFATRNQRIDIDGPDIQRLIKSNSFYYNDNTYDYLNSLIKSYKGAAKYQFLGLLFKDQLISTERIEVPSVEGKMGCEKYYMFSLEPETLLKMSFILHRTKANETEMPTYQRLLVPSRISGITKFIDQGGYFPNSIILNFTEKKHKVQFEYSTRGDDTNSRFGTLKIPSAYSIAYIIDGQHRLYGYANSKYSKSNTIPVLAFVNLSHKKQLEMFMDINQNQKAVSPDLRGTLEEDLYWDSDRIDTRLKALRSSIIRDLGESIAGPLYNKISIGEDLAILKHKPFSDALIKSKLLPKAKGNKYEIINRNTSLYDISNHNHIEEMQKCKRKVVQFINDCYEFVEENYPGIYNRPDYFILSNRGTSAFICLIGSLNEFETLSGNLNVNSSNSDRIDSIKKYLIAVLDGIISIEKSVEDEMLTYYGSGAESKWLSFFQSFVNKKYKEYEPKELIDWKERQDEQLQNEGRKYGIDIEKYLKASVIKKLKQLFNDDWDLEIGKIQRDCELRAKQETERLYKEGLGRKETPWTDMFFITDYLEIIKKYWTSKPKTEISDFLTFEKEFSIDVGYGFNSKDEKTKWISIFNSHRNLWAHEGSKDKRLNREEVNFLKTIHAQLYKIKL